MPKLILHAGTHKTGTTAIQAFAARNRAALLNRGLLYPSYAPLTFPTQDGHHLFAHAIAQTPGCPSLDDVRTLVRHWHAAASESDSTVLVSAEALYRHRLGDGSTHQRRHAYLRRVSEMLDAFDVELVLVFRRPDDFVRSMYQEHIASPRTRRSLPSLHAWATAPDRFQLHYHESAQIFQSIFPKTRILLYEDLIGGNGLYENFFSSIGCDISGIPTPGRIRAGLPATHVVAKNYANSFLSGVHSHQKFLKWLESSEVSHAFDEAFGGTRFDLWRSHEERERFLESRAEDIEQLRRDFFPDRPSLFPPLRPQDTAPPVPDLPIRIKDLIDRRWHPNASPIRSIAARIERFVDKYRR